VESAAWAGSANAAARSARWRGRGNGMTGKVI